VEAPPFERLGIVGLGCIGGSVALAARRRWPSIRIAVCDPAPVAAEAVTQGLAEAVVATPAELADRDLIIIATPVQDVAGVLAQLSEAGVKALVTDVAGTKRVVMAAAKSASGLRFIGGNPVAGDGASGLAAARADVFDGRAWLLVSASAGSEAESDEVTEAMLASFVAGLGARPEWTDAETHDRVLAHVSHAPQVVAHALMQGSASTEAWQGIIETNADFIADALVAIAAKLPTSSAALTETPAVRAVFERARSLKAKG